MKKLLLCFLGLSTLLSCSSGIEGEGAATAHKEFKVGPFSSLDASCNCELTLIPSDSTKIVVESHQNLVDNLEVVVKGNEVTLKELSPVSTYDLYNVIVYYNPDLKEIDLNKQTKMKVSGTFKSDKLKLDLQDQASIDETFVEITNMELDLSDQASIRLTGTIISLDIESSDQSKAELTGTQAVEIKFSASDNSQLALYAMKDLKGKATQTAAVTYKGNPTKDTTEKDQATIQQN